MKILSLELYKYDRFMLKGIEYFRYEPDTVIQIILGPNGSGKSSLLKELSPLPADLNEYTKGGYKRIKILHNNFTYELLSEKGEKGNMFSFLKDGNELNQGHTVTVFRDIVRVEFGISPEIHELMTGNIRFSEMDTAARRSWFTRLPSTDYTYAIRYYKKLSEALRDATGAIKHVAGKLLTEKDKAISDAELETIKEDLKHLKNYLTYVLESKKSVPYSVNEAESYISEANANIIFVYKRMAKLISSFNNIDNARSIEELATQFKDVHAEYASANRLLTHIFNEASKLEQSIEELERNQADSVEHLQKKMSERKSYINSILNTITLNLEFADPLSALESLNTASVYLLEITNELKPDPSRSYGREFYDKLCIQEQDLLRRITIHRTQIEQWVSERKVLLHQKEHNNVTCPECTHVFNTMYSANALIEIEKCIEDASTIVTGLEKSVEEVVYERTALVERFELLKGFTQVTKSYSNLSPFWDYLRTKVLFDCPEQTVCAIETLRSDLMVQCEVHRLSEDDKREAESLKIMTSFKNASLSDLKIEYERLSTEVYQLQEKKTSLQYKLKTIESALSIAKEVHDLKLELETSLDDRKERLESLTDIIQNELRSKMIQAIQMEITSRENKVSSITSHNRIITDLESQLDNLQKRKDVLYAATKVLSPSEGLIAKGITGFINHFVGQMNNFIKKIWTHRFEIVPIIPDANLNLDYKFELKIGDNGSSSDISKISRGQKEIIDLAFRTIAAQYLGLGHSPLYLDEFGASFDKEHRQAVSEMMHSLSSTSSFSQVYIISHYEEMYGSFKNTDITVFHDPLLETMTDSAFNKVAVFG